MGSTLKLFLDSVVVEKFKNLISMRIDSNMNLTNAEFRGDADLSGTIILGRIDLNNALFNKKFVA